MGIRGSSTPGPRLVRRSRVLEASAITSALALVGLAVLSWRIHRASDRARLQALGQEIPSVNEEAQPVATTEHEQIVETGSSTNNRLERRRDVALAEEHRFRAEQQASWASETYARIFAESWEQREATEHLVGKTLPDYSYEYTLPFSAGFGYRVIQGPYGSFSTRAKLPPILQCQ